MADTKQTPNPSMQNQAPNAGRTDHAEQGSRNQEQAGKAGFPGGKDSEKSAIGGGETHSRTGEPGRTRNELDKDRTETAASDKR